VASTLFTEFGQSGSLTLDEEAMAPRVVSDIIRNDVPLDCGLSTEPGDEGTELNVLSVESRILSTFYEERELGSLMIARGVRDSHSLLSLGELKTGSPRFFGVWQIEHPRSN
jgi:hypothetical protein